MFHQNWLEVVQQALGEIENKYPTCSEQERPKMRQRLQSIRETCHQLLESWAEIEERIALLLDQFPDLEADEQEVTEEFWLKESSVRSFRQGQGYYGLNMFGKANDIFSQVVKAEPDFILGRIYLALSQFQDGNYQDALQQFKMVLATASHDIFRSFAHHMIGCIYVKQGNDPQAIKEFSKAVAITPDSADGWFNLGACYFRLKYYHEAIPYFYHALSNAPDDWEAMYYLAECYAFYQEWESVHFWRLHCLEKTNHPKVIESLAYDYEEMNEPEQAIYWYRKLLFSPTHQLKGIEGIAWNLWRLGKKGEASAWLKKGLTLDPTHPDLLFFYGWLLWKSGETAKLERLIANLPKDQQEIVVWQVLKSHALFAGGRYEEALSLLDSVIERESGNAQALGYFQKGRLLLELDRTTEAMDCFRQAQVDMKRWEEPEVYLRISQMLEGRKV